MEHSHLNYDYFKWILKIRFRFIHRVFVPNILTRSCCEPVARLAFSSQHKGLHCGGDHRWAIRKTLINDVMLHFGLSHLQNVNFNLGIICLLQFYCYLFIYFYFY